MKHQRLYLLGVGTLLLAPVLAGLIYAVAASLDMVGFVRGAAPGFARIGRVFADPVVWRGTAWSLWVALASTTIASALAVGIAMLFRTTRRLDVITLALASVPLAVPHLTAAITWLLILGQSGMFARVLTSAGVINSVAQMPPLVSDPWGVGAIVTLVWKECPFLLLIASATLATRGATFEEVARAHGATPRQVFQRVTWPLLWRGMAAAVVAVAIFAFGTYETLVLLAPSDPLALPLLTAERSVDPDLARRNDAYVLVIIGFAVAAAAVYLHERLRSDWTPRDA